MAYWLMKSEPGVYSITDLRKDRKTYWDGIRNYLARNNMREMKKGDKAFFYHSNAAPSAVVGVMKIVGEAYADPQQFQKNSKYYDSKATKHDPRWSVVDVKFEKNLDKPVTLNTIKKVPALKDMDLLRLGRLSVGSVTAAEWKTILKLGTG